MPRRQAAHLISKVAPTVRFSIPAATAPLSAVVATSLATIAVAKDLQPIVAKIANLPANSLIVWDLDNTIMEPKQLIGSDQWFEQLSKDNITKHNGDKAAAIKETVDTYNYVQKHTHAKPVESNTVEVINKAKTKHRVIGLTTRGKEISDATFKQLNSINVSFALTPTAIKHDVPLDLIMENCPYSMAKDSVIFAGGRNKADCLEAYLSAMEIPLSSIPHLVFVDDKIHHVQNIAAMATRLGIPCTSFHYTYLDHKLPHVNMKMAEVQLTGHKHFGFFLNDSEAFSIVKRMPVKPALPPSIREEALPPAILVAALPPAFQEQTESVPNRYKRIKVKVG